MPPVMMTKPRPMLNTPKMPMRLERLVKFAREIKFGFLAVVDTDLCLGPDADAASGFVEDQDFKIHRKPLADDDFLLVPTAQISHQSFRVRGLDLK